MLATFAITNSPLGRLLVGGTAVGLRTVRLGESDAALTAGLERDYPGTVWREDSLELAPAVGALLRHLSGSVRELTLPLDVAATPFQRRVWAALRAIPYGETRSYAAVAALLGSPGGARAVARACAANPVALVIPCHRVVREDGEPGGYRWGAERKRRLLALEQAVLRAPVLAPGGPRR